MSQLPLPLDPLTAAVTPYLPAELVVADPAATLAALIDLAGGVALAEGLADVDQEGAGGASAAAVRQLFREGTAHVLRQLDAAFETAWRPRFRLPTAARAQHILDSADAWDGGRKAVHLAARTLWSPFADFLETQLKRARFALRDLQVELTPPLCGLGPDAARLVHLDAALRAGTKHGLEGIYRRIPGVWSVDFERRVAAAIKGATPVPAWFEPGGCVRAAVEDGQRLVRALVERERGRLAALVEAACALAADTPAR